MAQISVFGNSPQKSDEFLLEQSYSRDIQPSQSTQSLFSVFREKVQSLFSSSLTAAMEQSGLIYLVHLDEM